jgi:hypothetical protein
VEATRRELAKCQAELAASRAELAEERRKHTYNVRRMLDASAAITSRLQLPRAASTSPSAARTLRSLRAC